MKQFLYVFIIEFYKILFVFAFQKYIKKKINFWFFKYFNALISKILF